MPTNCSLYVALRRTTAPKAVARVIKELSTDGPKENLEKFTSFRTRRTSPQLLPLELTLTKALVDYRSQVK
jgi:hypothetical protein